MPFLSSALLSRPLAVQMNFIRPSFVLHIGLKSFKPVGKKSIKEKK